MFLKYDKHQIGPPPIFPLHRRSRRNHHQPRKSYPMDRASQTEQAGTAQTEVPDKNNPDPIKRDAPPQYQAAGRYP
jgi:hypothetical protein